MLFPKPIWAEFSEKYYRLKKDYRDLNLVDFFKKIKEGNADVRVMKAPFMEKEEYLLSVDDKGIALASSCEEGLFRAATSLLQMIQRQNKEGQACVLQFAQIQDKPQLPRRGYMLDICRGRMPKMSTIKQIIDFLAELKYNEFQLYMEGDCFKYSAYPKYTEGFDCLDAADIEELDAYCRERFIDLVPNQNSFGHLAPWLGKEEFQHLGLCEEGGKGNTINPLLTESYEFVDGLYKSLLPHFASEYVNIGLDEAYGLGRYQIEEYCKKHGKGTVFMDWLNKLNTLTQEKYNKKVMFWADMIYSSEDLYDRIPKDAVALEWGYDLIQSQWMTEHCMKFQEAGLNYYVCPSCNTHLTFTGRYDVTTFNIRTAGELGTRFGAKGILLTDWGNGGHPHFWVFSAFPCALAGQYGWNAGEEQNGENFKRDFIREAESFVDEKLFGGVAVSEILYRMGNYYLLEPERVHCGTMCGEMFALPLSETTYATLVDLKNRGTEFYFDNVTSYMQKNLEELEKLVFDSQLKREIVLNARMAILASDLCKIRGGRIPDAEQIQELITEIDWMSEEYHELWCQRNFQKGEEIFLKQLADRKKELGELIEG